MFVYCYPINVYFSNMWEGFNVVYFVFNPPNQYKFKIYNRTVNTENREKENKRRPISQSSHLHKQFVSIINSIFFLLKTLRGNTNLFEQ